MEPAFGEVAPRAVDACSPFVRAVRAPGSKSVTNRALVLAALARGTTVLRNALRSDDTDALARAIVALGVQVTESDDGFTVHGCGGRLPAGGAVHVNLGDGGTPTRFAVALAALAPRITVIDGSARMRERPVADGVDLLRAIGARIRWVGTEGRLPVEVDGRGGAPMGGQLHVGQVASSQFVSAVMLAACAMQDALSIEFRGEPTSASYLDLTADELRAWRVPVDEIRSSDATLRAVRIRPAVPDAGGAREIEPDASSALYWAAAAVLVPGSAVTLTGLPERSSQPDMLAIRHLASMGAGLEAAPGGMRVQAAGGDADAAARLRPIVADCAACPDGALMLIAAAAVADGTSRVVGLGTLKAKESDRIAAMAEGLRAVGARATFGVDWIEIDPIPRGHRVDAVIDPHGDHRIAMSFAILGLRTGGIRVANPGCVAKSYPGFWDELDRTSRAHLRPFA